MSIYSHSCILLYLVLLIIIITIIIKNNNSFHNAVVLAIIAITIIGIAGFMIFRIKTKSYAVKKSDSTLPYHTVLIRSSLNHSY